MGREILLTPEELYYLGALVQAKYIDYAYVAAMDDINQNYALFEKETCAALVNAGIIMEDFSGNMEVDSFVLALVQPIFFGETETTLDICELGEKNKIDVIKYHFYDGAITSVSNEKGKLKIKAVNQDEIQEAVSKIVPMNYTCTHSEVIPEIDKETVTRFVVVKSVVVGQRSNIQAYIEANGVLCQEKIEGQIESVTKEMFISDAYSILKGV